MSIESAFAQNGKRAALMPYLMGGYPGLRDRFRLGWRLPMPVPICSSSGFRSPILLRTGP